MWSIHSPEHIKLRQLDWSNIRVISAVLGQSVALDFYARCLPLQRLHGNVTLACMPVMCTCRWVLQAASDNAAYTWG